MIIGIVFYGFIIASVAAGLANADAQRARYQERLDAIKTFLKVKGHKTLVNALKIAKLLSHSLV